jgi:hypothetical protein
MIYKFQAGRERSLENSPRSGLKGCFRAWGG